MNSLFSDHGTKILGGLTTVIGTVGSLDPEVIQSIFGSNGMAYFTTLAGVLTILRGFQNGKAQGPQPPK